MPRDVRRIVGSDGCITLILSNIVLLATGGLLWLWYLRQVHRLARSSPTTVAGADLALVLGYRLGRVEAIVPEYAERLCRAQALFSAGEVSRIMLVGGCTGARSTASEAEAGQRFLVGRGIPPAALAIEDQSQHTLQNLHHARAALQSDGKKPFALVTSRYHLARAQALAHGLGLHPLPCAAEERLNYGPRTLLRLGREAYFLHWYVIGRTWSTWTGNRHSLARIT
jgi:uncharacterized SAM-binding protein YcdF (DUF218 family)